MTDEERLLALLLDLGLKPDAFEHGHADYVRLEAGRGGVDGLPGASCDFLFDVNGAFLRVGVWE